MAGPASPPFVNPAANALHQAVDDGLTSGGIPVVTSAEAGMADIRHASAIAQSFGEAMAPPWFAGALAAGLAPIQAQIADMQAQIADMQAQIAPILGQLASLQAQAANVTVTRNNVQASKEGDFVQFEFISKFTFQYIRQR
jgi:hypothetical protein